MAVPVESMPPRSAAVRMVVAFVKRSGSRLLSNLPFRKYARHTEQVMTLEEAVSQLYEVLNDDKLNQNPSRNAKLLQNIQDSTLYDLGFTKTLDGTYDDVINNSDISHHDHQSSNSAHYPNAVLASTVVHRPIARVRPSSTVARLELSVLGRATKPENGFDADTGSSSPHYSRSSPLDTSTPATSLDSVLGTSKDWEKALTAMLDFQPHEAKVLTPIPETPMVKPTIKTVEAAVNTKIFFETNYNSLFRHPNGRARRCQRLDQLFHEAEYSLDHHHALKKKHQAEESTYLRRIRTAKTQQLLSKFNSQSLNAQKYEVLRILGKGSFGVVRLVREKLECVSDEAIQSTPTVTCENINHTTDKAIKDRSRSIRGSKVYAMKVIRKSEMLRNGQEAHIRAERDMLVEAKGSDWIVPLVESFEDRKHLYLVMDFMIGGDFLALLIKEDRLEERIAKFYVAEMILCLEESHRLGWIHRDVKPDNFLISASGHLKISDFGLAFDGHWSHDQHYWHHQRYSLVEKLGIAVIGDEQDYQELESATPNADLAEVFTGPKERKARRRHEQPSSIERQGLWLIDWRNDNSMRHMARSVVGTSQYMAPEVIRGEVYDGRCDWWSIGIILFECLFGETPFIRKDRQATKHKIITHRGELRISQNPHDKFHVSKIALHLINSLLKRKETRLSCESYLRNDSVPTANPYADRLAEGVNSPSRPPPQFLYPDDAADIKSHPFFRDIDWTSLHKARPPMIPRVRHCCDTRYFDQEAPVSEVEYRSTDSEDKCDSTRNPFKVTQGNFDAGDMAWSDANGSMIDCLSPLTRKPKAKKRAKDRILRDEATMKDAMQLRKTGAFLGYTYRRPHDVLFST